MPVNSEREILCDQYVRARLIRSCNPENHKLLSDIHDVMTLSLEQLSLKMTTNEIQQWAVLLKYLRKQFIIESMTQHTYKFQKLYSVKKVTDMCDAYWS